MCITLVLCYENSRYIIQNSAVLASPVPVIELVKTISLKSGKQGVIVCVKVSVRRDHVTVVFAIIEHWIISTQ